jgi:hypothetical protein
VSKIKIEDEKGRKNESEGMVRKRVREWEYGGKKECQRQGAKKLRSLDVPGG